MKSDSNPDMPNDPAPLARRLGAAFYDTILVAGLLVVASAVVTLPVGVILGQESAATLSSNMLFRIWLLLVPLLFFTWFWTHGGQTLGMKSWRLKIVDEWGDTPSPQLAVIRYFAAILSWLPLGLGFIWCLFDAEGRTWHDRLSATHLIVLPKD
jgi:uncharacterized RDD family membrane protein YckC